MGHIKLFESTEGDEYIQFIKSPDGNLWISILNEDYEMKRFFIMGELDTKILINDLEKIYK